MYRATREQSYGEVANHSQMGPLSPFLELDHATGRQAGDPILPTFSPCGRQEPAILQEPGTPGAALALPPRQAHPAAAPRLSSRLTLYPAPHQALTPSSSMKQRGHAAATNVPAPTNGHRPSECASRRPAAPTATQVKGQKKKKKKSGLVFKPAWRGNTGSPHRRGGDLSSRSRQRPVGVG